MPRSKTTLFGRLPMFSLFSVNKHLFRKTGALKSINVDGKVSIFYPHEVVVFEEHPPEHKPLFSTRASSVLVLETNTVITADEFDQYSPYTAIVEEV